MTTLSLDLTLASLVKPTVDTPFHIDYEWWQAQAVDINIHLLAHLPGELREAYVGKRVDEKIDLIDRETGEVQQVEGLQYLIATRCSEDANYIIQAPTLLEAVFRVFLSNGNRALSPRALSLLVGQQPRKILQVLAAGKVRKGLRPVVTV